MRTFSTSIGIIHDGSGLLKPLGANERRHALEKVSQVHGGEPRPRPEGHAPATTAAVGSGRYKLESWERGSRLVLRRNDDYWGVKGKPQALVYRGIPDANTRVSELLTGGVDWSDMEALKEFYIANSRRLAMAGKILFPVPNRRLSKRLYRLAAETLILLAALLTGADRDHAQGGGPDGSKAKEALDAVKGALEKVAA